MLGVVECGVRLGVTSRRVVGCAGEGPAANGLEQLEMGLRQLRLAARQSPGRAHGQDRRDDPSAERAPLSRENDLARARIVAP